MTFRCYDLEVSYICMNSEVSSVEADRSRLVEFIMWYRLSYRRRFVDIDWWVWSRAV